MTTKKEQYLKEVMGAVGAGKAVTLDTVDFNDPNRTKTCLEVDFPILSVNQVAAIEVNAGKPIYQMSKWWARRRSSVFRAMLLAAATKSPDDPAEAAKVVWENYYANHQKKGVFRRIKVADIFMGGGTTLVEGSRLGMQMTGNDLNPVAWFIVNQELASVDLDQVNQLLSDIEKTVKPQIIPYYACDGPNGEKGRWTHLPTSRVMPESFDPLCLTPEERCDYGYEGPEAIYTFWAKHGPCQMSGCGHRTPIMKSPIIAIKALTIKYWEYDCEQCHQSFDIEEQETRMAPDVPFYVSPSEKPFFILDSKKNIVCPHCGYEKTFNHIKSNFPKSKSKKIEMTLLVNRTWLAGSANQTKHGKTLGGSAQDDYQSSQNWMLERASQIGLLEVRGPLPKEVVCPQTDKTFKTDCGTVSQAGKYICGACGVSQGVLPSVKATGKTGPMAAYAIQGYSPRRKKNGKAYGGRFFSAFNEKLANQYNAALKEWNARKDTDLAGYWPRSEIPNGVVTHIKDHGFTHWWTMFNARQLLVHTQLLKAIVTVGNYDWPIREYVLGAFQNYLRNQSMFSFWHLKLDKLAPAMSNSNFHPKSNVIEVGVFAPVGYGQWSSTIEILSKSMEWALCPWEVVSVENLRRDNPILANQVNGKSAKVQVGDAVGSASLFCASSTDLVHLENNSIDLVITDPPFSDLLQYAELSDFFYVWLRLVLKDKYPQQFGSEYTQKSLEVVANRAREPQDPEGFYKRLLTACWKEAHRILKPGGILAFTFHHSQDEPWVTVLESLFDAGYYLEATYPIRSDETKGDGEFGSKTIEYDIIHVCRKRIEAPKPISWAKMRHEIVQEIELLQTILAHHKTEGLPEADVHVIRRSKALEYFSRHYGQVYVGEGQALSVKDVLLGVHQLINESVDTNTEALPLNVEPLTREFLRIFGKTARVDRDQLQKFLKGSITTPKEFVDRSWCKEINKAFYRVDWVEFSKKWVGKHKRRLSSDLDQAFVLIGACFEESGINVLDTLQSQDFRPHFALESLLEWFSKHSEQAVTRRAALTAKTIYKNWQQKRQPAKSYQDELI